MSSENKLPMCLYGRTSVHEFLGDCMVYRGLNACDDRLPGLKELQSRSGLPGGYAPRKHEAQYAQLVSILLHLARQIDAPNTSLKRIIFIGDTRMSDVGAFQNLCQAGSWEGMVFIGSEEPKPAKVEITPAGSHPVISNQTLYLANRWAFVEEFNRYIQEQKFPVDESTVVVVDLDKTALGGRGRNSTVIDRARVQAVRQTVAGHLGDSFDPTVFQLNYDRLNKPEFHGFTADNQDFLAYICLVLGCGFESTDQLIGRIKSSTLVTFEQFIQQVELQKQRLPSALGEIHSEIYSQVQAGDPTPFKEFRRNEYRLTAGQMGCLQDHEDIQTILSEEIVITQEVRAQALKWRDQGALLFGLSDKPDEASIPPIDLARLGWQPLHRTITHAIGQRSDQTSGQSQGNN